MKKTFLLQAEGKNPDRILEAVKHEVRKYARREGRKTVPEGFDYWDFDCKVGVSPEAAAAAEAAAERDGDFFDAVLNPTPSVVADSASFASANRALEAARWV